jgi:hypothetical protein
VSAVIRISAAILALNELVVGAWNQFWPESFYTDFPTVHLTPPFSEHYARDFGGATLGIAVVLLAAAIAPSGVLTLVAGLAYSAFGIPHFVFHAAHLEHATDAESVFLILGNGASAALGVLLVVLGVLRMGRDRRLHDPALDGSARRRRRQRAGGGVRGPVP